jgi:hypothetical protein
MIAYSGERTAGSLIEDCGFQKKILGFSYFMKHSSLKKSILASVIIVAVLLVSLVLIIRYIEKKSEAKFFLLLSEFKEGMPYSKVEEILSRKPERILTEPNDVEEWGPIKDSKITQECILHMFLCVDVIPHRFILIYEDKKIHTVRYIDWKYT